MASDNEATRDVVGTHPDGSPAVRSRVHSERTLYDALDTLGLCVGVYDNADHARSAANWARDFLLERPDLPRMAMMQLIIDKLRWQYPEDSAEVVLGPSGE